MKSIRWITYLLAFTCSLYTMPAVLSGGLPSREPETTPYVDAPPPVESATAPVNTRLQLVSESVLRAEDGESEPVSAGSHYLLMQLSNSNAVCDGETIRLASGFGLAARPFYTDGHSMVPLRILAETFGYMVTWDGVCQQITVTGKDTHAVFTVGSFDATQNGQTLNLNTPVVLLTDTVYVPARDLCQILGCYLHYYDKTDGEFLLISDYPVSAGDLAGDGNANADYNGLAYDESLLSFKQLGNTYLGPSQAMYCADTLFLRCGCAYSILNGVDTLITVQDSGQTAPIKTSDGLVLVPLEYCARAFGAHTEETADGAGSLTSQGKTSVFPIASGYFIRDGISISDQAFVTMKFDGVVYVTVQAVAAALDIYYTDYDSGVFSLSAYHPEEYDSLSHYADLQAAELLLKPAIKGYIALTFDDGPNGDKTDRLLDGLDERGVQVTFFLCDFLIGSYPDLMYRYIAEGHEIGNHSASHPNMTNLTGREIEAEIDSTNETIMQYTGVQPRLFRPPGGAYNQRVLSALADRSMSCVLWSIDPKDWRDHNSQLVVSRVLTYVTDGSIILLHDSYNTSVDAGLEIIDQLQAQGYKFVTVSDLAFIQGYDLAAGQAYRNFPQTTRAIVIVS